MDYFPIVASKISEVPVVHSSVDRQQYGPISWPYHSVPDGQQGIRYSSSRSFAHFHRIGHILAVGSMVSESDFGSPVSAQLLALR
ncbi:unnamed protein product [Brassica oleracea]|uniref:(rape) hypothetical protein n=1 Tax=Brassica napus TaxID=3708 RepID=A0A816NE05_BRANA|nr:unnamed protein product [Brassica napus]